MRQMMSDTYETETSNRNSPSSERGNGNHNLDMNQPVQRPFRDADNLYEIPRIRPEDPPMRRWWTDDEPSQHGSGPEQNG